MGFWLHFDIKRIANIIARCETHSEKYQKRVYKEEIFGADESDAYGKDEVHIQSKFVYRLTTINIA